MKSRLALFFLSVILVAILAACGRQPTLSQQATMSPLVGIWQSEHTAIEFSSDGTGVETREGRLFEFSWIENDGILTFSFTYDAEGSAINALMQAVLHGVQVESFGFYFSDDGNELTITDDHGHGHFRLILTRTDYVGEVNHSPNGLPTQGNGNDDATSDTVGEHRAGDIIEMTPEELAAIAPDGFPHLGLALRAVRSSAYAPNLAHEFEFLQIVAAVAPNTAASAAGILVGDLIVTTNGESFDMDSILPQFRDLMLEIEIAPIGASGATVFRILRDGVELEITAFVE